VAEPDKSLTVTLSDPRGCATLGTQASATLTILDDDRPEPPPPPSGLDETFGSQGKTSLAGFGDESGMAIQPDGKIVVAGEATVPSGDLAVTLVRYNADGTLDLTFGSGGKVFGPAVLGRAFDVAILSDGRIVVAGDAPVANIADDFGDFLLARYQASGLLDTTFGTNGVVVQDMTSRTDLARNIVVQPNGALVVSGDPFGSDPSRRTSIARYDADGHLDTSFATGGKLILAGAYVGAGLALQSDGRLVLVGTVPVLSVQNDFTHFAVMRLNADGTFDDYVR
jgi:uncharacterized delta-60 repeat protein